MYYKHPLLTNFMYGDEDICLDADVDIESENIQEDIDFDADA
jgi:hypothetical protein